jgi:hypothetical protein
MYDKPITPKKPIVPYQISDKLRGPIRPKQHKLDIPRVNPNKLTGFDDGDHGKSRDKNDLRAIVKQDRFTHGNKVADKLDKFL